MAVPITASGSTNVKRYIAECSFHTKVELGQVIEKCDFNKREEPRLHKTEKQAIAEALDHAKTSHHFSAKQVKVKRERQVIAERIVE